MKKKSKLPTHEENLLSCLTMVCQAREELDYGRLIAADRTLGELLDFLKKQREYLK